MEAIRQLELRLVYSIPNKGCSWKESQARTLRIIRNTECMEGLAARWAIERMDEQSSRSWKIYAS